MVLVIYSVDGSFSRKLIIKDATRWEITDQKVLHLFDDNGVLLASFNNWSLVKSSSLYEAEKI
jgi:hypothetical protein